MPKLSKREFIKSYQLMQNACNVFVNLAIWEFLQTKSLIFAIIKLQVALGRHHVLSVMLMFFIALYKIIEHLNHRLGKF